MHLSPAWAAQCVLGTHLIYSIIFCLRKRKVERMRVTARHRDGHRHTERNNRLTTLMITTLERKSRKIEFKASTGCTVKLKLAWTT